MHVSTARSVTLIGSAVLLLLGACSKQEDASEQVSNAAAQASSAIKTESWVDDVRVSGVAATGASPAQSLTPGTQLQVSMSVADAPQGTVVTTYWYGPENRQLAYESQTVEPQQRQMSFTQENTHDWPAGTYHAEIWVGQDKVEEETFEIVTG
ncbi:MAG: hypothetical protein SXG53_20165 [Pseudomonadota bacterium]|nr:hypothetical protein [Pseudomonadota bacterium]